ncbi:MAG TPA: SBBP repeat-containing protein [Ignavibacteria bacterium]|nr:SBBP repeat-containing protein [Ignavibacteria bacterium]
MKILNLILLMIVASMSVAQNPVEEWVSRFNGNGTINKYDNPEDMIVDDSGNVYITGTSYVTFLKSNIVTLKYNNQGVLQWSTFYNQAGFADVGKSIACDDSGNVYVAGTSRNTVNNTKYALIKYNASGVQQWVVHYGDTATTVDMVIDNSGNIILTGVIFKTNTLNDIVTVKYNPSGIQLSTSTFIPSGINEHDYVTEISTDQFDNFYICGSFYNSLNTSGDILLIKYNSSGVQQWVKTYHNSISNSDESSSGISINNNGDIFVTGSSYDNTTSHDIITLKYDQSGNLIWDLKYIGDIILNAGDYGYDITSDNFGNCYVTGSVADPNLKFITLKYNSNGVLLWHKRYIDSLNYSMEGKSISVDNSGNVYVTGNTGYNEITGSEYITIKYDASGSLIWEMKYNGFEDFGDMALKNIVDNNGNVYVTGTSSIPVDEFDITTIKYSQGSVYTLTNPIASEKWIAGEKDTIKWSGGEAGKFVTLEISKDSGLTYDMIDFAIPADSGKYVWDIPEDIISTRCIIQILNTATNDTLAKSPAFKIKGYILTKFDGMGRYDIFDPNFNGWAYNNNPNPMWPASWYSGRFNYLINDDPYTNSSYPEFFKSSYGAINFPDWPLWVEVFGVNRNYWSTFFKIYDKSAQEKWGSSVSNNFQGSCFGFAASSFLYFSYKPQLLTKHPGMPNVNSINSVPIDDSVRKIINGYYLYQFGEQSIENDLASQVKTPKQTLKELKEMFINDEVDIRTITIFNDPDKAFPGNNNGAHTMAPIGVVKDTAAGKFRVILYDSNNPNDYPYILVDTVANRWSFPNLGATWQGTKKFYLEIPVSNYINRPILSDRPIDNNNIKRGIENIEIFNTSDADIILKNSSNEEIGFVNGQLIENIENGIPIIAKTGGNSNPLGYYIPDDDYSIEISKVKDSANTSRVAIFKENKSFVFLRKDADSTQTDKIYVEGSETDGSARGLSGSSFSVSSPDNIQKNITLKLINDLNDKERYFEISGVEMVQNDSLNLNEIDSNIIIKNFGSEKTYSLNLSESNSSESKIFENAFVMLPANSTHIIQPVWDNLDSANVIILIDSGNNGSIDDTISILNEFELPVELISFTSSVSKRDVNLNWTTSMELNNSGFEIERKYISDINSNWSKITFIQGNGNSSTPINYSYKDRALNSGAYMYRLKQIDYNGNFEYFELSSEVVVGVPEKFDLSQNYPNPFNPVTKINYDLPFDSRVMMKVYDITGREVYSLVNEQKPAGYYTVQFDAGLYGSLSSGVYFYRLIAKGINGQEFVLTKKMMLVK